ncbi:unnamed protein product [Phytophthora lilii]|uniref:Unnamed protein product n=1 Tax=Phytophthora lilii TaxID=2077276 RepID=A0A9W6WTL4_9STRA|nr:unnamed protein product [Phytophthora lilii]
MNCGSLTINGSSLDLSGHGYVSGVTPGAASASKALVLDSSSNISGINSLQTTSVVLGSATLTSTEANYLIGLTTGVAQANKVITLNGSLNVSGINNLSASISTLLYKILVELKHIGSTTAHQLALRTNGSRRLTISSGGNVSIADTATGLQIDLGSTGTGLNVPNLTFGGTSFPNSYYTGVNLAPLVTDTTKKARK